MKKMFALAFCAATVATAASAQQRACDAMLNTTIEPITFDAASELLRSAPLVKDEFETTAAFEARVAAARQTMPTSLAISVDLNKEYAVYNADARKFVIDSRIFGSDYGIDWFSAFYSSPVKPAGYTMGSNVVGLAISSVDTPNGTYMGQNAYGASWEIVKINRDVDAIFDSISSRYDQKLFGRGLATDFKWDAPAPPEFARQFKEQMKGALIVAPNAPFYIESTESSGGRITIQNPRDVTQIAHVIIADVKCAVLTSESNVVVFAVTTN
ncbi:hypothetical protein [Brevundimonas phoenicis]|uniref:hypothetical protein n=1 Tax=unclassified Brevundimonas TaxID=2622653 RepID=UPI0039A3ABAD